MVNYFLTNFFFFLFNVTKVGIYFFQIKKMKSTLNSRLLQIKAEISSKYFAKLTCQSDGITRIQSGLHPYWHWLIYHTLSRTYLRNIQGGSMCLIVRVGV